MAHEKLPDLTEAQRDAIRALSKDERLIQAPVWLAQQAHIPNDAIERQHAGEDPEGFWREKAKLVDWMRPFEQVYRFDLPKHEWFVGGKLNATLNCIDRHTLGDKRLKAALIWVGEDGEEHTYTYNRLYREVNRFANALKKLGVKKGDRVIVYMPL
ncbi:MAG TPA: acetyl-coenzyme A synthetase N-terminal domain-containing protein, partial [Anaeromyxobacter sp.]|nr:acetyl-coenzyme A synthetase N-terminal domain-containing protein [Anaeromyxobacter sp.]